MTAPTLSGGFAGVLKVTCWENVSQRSIPYDNKFIQPPNSRQLLRLRFYSTYFDHIQQFQTVGCSRIFPFPNEAPTAAPALIWRSSSICRTIQSKVLERVTLQQADTFEELAKKHNNPPEYTFCSDCLPPYNELADKGEDEDFYKTRIAYCR
jgi:hypothetical protein